MARVIEVVMLGHPHLVLANVTGDDGVVRGNPGELADEGRAGDRGHRVIVVGRMEAAGGVPGAALFLPFIDGQWLGLQCVRQ